MHQHPDEFEHFLETPTPAVDPDLQAKVLQRTGGVLRRRRYVRRLGFAAALAICYLAGLFTMKWPATGPKEQQAVVPKPAESVPRSLEKPATHPGPEGTAVVMEYRALDSSTDRAALYRKAGDRYQQAGDMESAVRCYRNAINNDSAQDLRLSTDDDWLLMALKEAKRKEQQHEQHDG